MPYQRTASVSENCKQTLMPLITGLPDDIALCCLARVPRKNHHVLRCVSKRWRALLCSKEWSTCRQKYNLEETLIFALCKDKFRVNCCYVLDTSSGERQWRPIHNFSPKCLKKEGMSFEAVGSKLYFLGGCSWAEDATNQVHCYDICANKWEDATSMPTARCFFTSAALNTKLYVSGGLVLDYDAPKTWDIYDTSSNSWSSQSDEDYITADFRKSIALDGKIYTICKNWIGENQVGVYDPLCRALHKISNGLLSCWRGPTVVVDETLYMLDETSGTRLMMWDKETEDWVALGRLSHKLTRPPCQLAAAGRSIFVVGQGLSTVVIDLDMIGKVGGVLVSSSLMHKFDHNLSVISCKAVSI